MQEYCRRLPISCIDDLAQLIAAYRPSTARAGVTEQYVRVREGRDPIDCYHTLLDDVLRPTGGKMIYQEQIIEVFMLIAGYTRAQADNVRRIMGKMLGEEALSKHKTAFLEGGLSRGLSKELISRLWNDLKYFSIYGFNKSHSVAYALICYHTAYLKYYYPIEFFCACLCFEDDKMKFREFLYQAKQRGIIVKGPCLNSSRESFSIAVEDGERLIRFGLSSVKNCGQKSVEEIVRKQPYKTWEEFLSRVNRTVVNVRVQQYLVMSGAMDSIVNWDEQDPLEEHQKVISKWRNDLLKKINKHDGTDHTCAYYEHESLGEHLLNHPINRYRDRLDASGFRSIRDTLELSAGELSLAGIVARVNETTTKNNQEMAFVKIADETGSIDLIFWPDSWAAYKSQIESARCLAVKGSLSEDRRNIIVRLAREVV
jgi:DNA polymerase-3 subunit alpha